MLPFLYEMFDYDLMIIWLVSAAATVVFVYRLFITFDTELLH